MDSALLPARSSADLPQRGFEPLMCEAFHELNAMQSPCTQAAQKLQPECLFLTSPDCKARYLALTGLSDPNGNHHGCTHKAMVLPHCEVHCIQPPVGIHRLERTLAKLLHHRIERHGRCARRHSYRCPSAPGL
jgi:hypothetical protein